MKLKGSYALALVLAVTACGQVHLSSSQIADNVQDQPAADGGAGLRGLGGSAKPKPSEHAPANPPDAGATLSPSFENGSRLHAVYDFIEPDIRVLRAWHDAQLDVDCTFETPGPNGVRHCLPAKATTTDLFADAQCTQAVLRDAVGSMATLLPVDPCRDLPTLVSIGELVPADKLFEVGPQGCIASGPGQVGPFRLTKTLSLNALVIAHERIDSARGRIVKLELIADDGASQVISGYDTERAQPVLGRADLPTRWWPSGILVNDPSLFADASCQGALAERPMRSSVCQVSAVQLAHTFYQVGRQLPVDSALYEQATDASCTMTTVSSIMVPPPDSFFEIGDPIADTKFALRTQLRIGAGRIQQDIDGSPERDPIVPSASETFWDAQYQSPCSLLTAADAQLHCLPKTVSSASLFSDAACTKSITVISAQADEPGFAKGALVSLYRGAAMPTFFEAHEVGMELSASELFERATHGSCSAADPGHRYHVIGPSVAPAQFVLVVQRK